MAHGAWKRLYKLAFKDDDCCFLGRGSLYSKPCDDTPCGSNPFGPTFPFNIFKPQSQQVNQLGQFLGNVSDFTITPTFERRQKIFRSGNFNATDCNTKIITGANVSITLECTNMENLARAFCGEVKEHPACPAPPECICWSPCPGPGGSVICENEAIEFEKPGIDPESVEILVVDPDGTETPLVFGEDFTADCFCVTFLRNLTIKLKSYLKISYTYDSKFTCVEGLSGEGLPVSLTFKGCNATKSGSFYRVKVHRVFFDPVDSFSFISDDLQSISLNGTLEPVDKYRLKDSDTSQWFEICRINKGKNK